MSKKVIITICCVAVVAAGAAVAVRLTGNSEPAAEAIASQVTVSASRPTVGDVALNGEFIGTVEPDQQVQVFPKVSGTVLRTYFEIGQQVKTGDLLYEIDPVDLQMAYDSAVAKLEASKIEAQQKLGSGYDSSLISLKAQLDAAQTQLNSARSSLRNLNDDADDDLLNAQKAEDKALAEMQAAEDAGDEEAYKKASEAYSLAHAQVKDLEDDDDPTLRSARTAYRNAQISYNAAKEAYDQAAGISRDDTEVTVDAGLHAAEVALEAQAKQLEYTKVYAPIDGIVEQKNISAHDLTSTSQPAYTVSNKSLMTVQFSVSQSAVGNLAVGDQVQVENSGKNVTGTITEISTMVDAQSGLFTVKASVDQADMPLFTGATVKIYAATEKATNSLLVPADAVYYDGEKPYLYVYRDGAAVKTDVETGVSDMNNIQIVSGITADDEVITTWHPRLLDGAAVVLKNSDTQASSSESASEEA
ncbi:MAG: efflux RND transporter periplasmic adaptor subunit [Ruminococcaceae bacterium]|nr:efflux RND transporter periplasmic adaptor subunit [Oscillospiraceae bacterium]